MRIKLEDTLALIIDYQDKIVPAMNKKEELLQNTQKLIEGLKILGVPSIVSQQYTKGLGMTIPEIKELYGEEFSYFDKKTFSCMDDADISEKLASSNKKNIIVCGIEAHVCVLQTVIDLISAGYNVILVEDCISSRKKHDKKIALQRMQSEGAILSTYESILFELTRVSGTDTFKQISRLVK